MREDGRASHCSHTLVTEFIRDNYSTVEFDMLDCGVMSGVTYETLKSDDLSPRYTGIDICGPVLDDCRDRHPTAPWLQMNVLDMAFRSDTFDYVNCRHLLEMLPYYETAVRASELFRGARRHVAICMFQVPRAPEKLLRRETPAGYIWLNNYAPERFESLLDLLSESVEVVDAAEGYRTERVYFCTKRHP
ncbi:methyltransferase domain-containing protein [Nocardia sp. NPDC051911]|uniref:methyltransferase domain-containing protein n=1 Tax=Nocardia sp. NPDC051911 TaxID=3154648 RepID=UPI00342D1B51